MGGNVAWTLRLADGTEYRMDRWTNIFPHVTSNDDFLLGKPEAIDEALRSWLEMKSDWERNGPKGPFEENMTDVYAPYPLGLRPSEYGVIVTDFISKTIVSCQHYTSGFTHIQCYEEYKNPERLREPRYFANLEEIVENEELFSQLPDNVKERLPEIEKEIRRNVYGEPLFEKYDEIVSLYEAGRIVGYCYRGREILIDAPLAELIDKAKHDMWIGYLVKSLPDGWQVLKFNSDTKEGRDEAFEAIKSLNFVLSSEEENDFNKWINRSYDDEDEDSSEN